MVSFSTLNGHLLQKTMTFTTMHSPHLLYPNSSTNNPISIITCARTTTNKGFFRSKQSRNTLIHLLRFTASHLPYMLPEPLNSVIREIGGGSGGGGGGGYGGNWKGFGWGGFDGGGRKKRVNKKFKFWVLGLGFVVVCWLGLGGGLEVKNDVVLGVMCLLMFLVLVRNGMVPEWVLGFCGGGLIVGMSVDKRGELNKFVGGLIKTMGVSRRQRRRRRGV